MAVIMGVIDRVRQFFTGAKEQRGVYVGWTGSESWWQSLLPRTTTSGIDVSPEIAYQIAVVYACVYKIASTVAMLPIHLIDESNDRFREIKIDPAVRLLNVTGDGDLPSFYQRQAMIAQMLLFGRGYAYLNRVEGTPVSMRYISTADVLEKIIDGTRMYRVTDRSSGTPTERWLPGSDVVALRYMFSQSPVMVNRDAVGLLKAAQDYSAQFFQNGGVMSGVLSSDQPITPEQIQTIMDTWAKQEGKQTRLLPFGFKYNRFGVEPDKAQSTESRKFNAQEVCRIFNMPPAMIGLEGGSSYGDYENQAKHFATHTIAPICAAIESELNIKLVFRDNQGVWKFRHDIDELMRGDMKARADYYMKMLNSGVFSRDEIRMIERYNPIEGGALHTVQVNQIALNYLEQYSEKMASTADAGNNSTAATDGDDDKNTEEDE